MIYGWIYARIYSNLTENIIIFENENENAMENFTYALISISNDWEYSICLINDLHCTLSYSHVWNING